jgi:integrase
MRLTKTFVDKISPPKVPKDRSQAQVFYRDSAIPGFGLRVMNTGVKSFIVEKRINGKVKRITLGRYGNLTVEQAKNQALKLLGDVATGKDPIAEKQATRIKGTSLEDTFEDYLKTRKDLKPGTIEDYTRSVKWGFGDWLNKPITRITKDMVETRHRELGQRSPARANNAARVLRALFNHARTKYEDSKGNPLILINPVDRLSQSRAWYKINPRQSYVKPSQLSAWYDATMILNNLTTRDYLHFLLLTGLRRSEGSRLEWSEVDFKERTVTILETKNHRVHVLPFSSLIEQMLERRLQESSSPFVFPSDSPRGYLVEPRTAVTRVSTSSGVAFTLHDLRRTFITIAESLDIPAYALKRLMNHKDPNDVTAGYIVSDINRLRVPMQRVTDYIEEHFHAGN